jgi:hypothetical protein
MLSNPTLEILPARISHMTRFTSIALLSLMLSACGGSGGGTAATPTATITDISPRGMVASASATTIIISGTNLASGMTITATDSGNINYAGITTYKSSLGNLSVPVTIATAPNPRYLTLTLKSSTGTVLATEILGVANVHKVLQSTPSGSPPATTDIQYIFNSNLCYTCHTSVSNIPDMSTNLLSASTLIDVSSTKCTGKYRVKAGDPRRENNVLLDVLQAKTTTAVLSCNNTTIPDRKMPQGAYLALSQPEIDAIIEWIAGGAY